MVAHYSPLGRWEGAFFFFLLTGGGVSCFLPDRKKRVGGFAGLQMWPVWWSPEGESSSGAEGVCRRREGGGGESFQPVLMGRKSRRRSLLQIFVCRNVFQAAPPCDRWHRGTMCFVFRVQSAASETHGPISGEVCGVGVSVALGAVGLCVEVLQPNVFLFQRDFFTVCFSPTLCVRARKAFCILGGAESREELGSIPTSHRSHESTIQFFFCG